MNIIDEINNEQMQKLAEDRPVPDFGPGDTLRVSVKVVEGERERVQAFEGVCIGRKNAGLNSAFTVRKISYGEGVERVFPLYSPAITAIEVVRRGAVRRAKLYYLRGRTGKRARIAEKTDWTSRKPDAAAPGAGAGAPAAEEAAPKPKKEAKKKKKKHDIEVPETGEPVEVTPDDVAEAAVAEAADEKGDKKEKKAGKKKADKAEKDGKDA